MENPDFANGDKLKYQEYLEIAEDSERCDEFIAQVKDYYAVIDRSTKGHRYYIESDLVLGFRYFLQGVVIADIYNHIDLNLTDEELNKSNKGTYQIYWWPDSELNDYVRMRINAQFNLGINKFYESLKQDPNNPMRGILSKLIKLEDAIPSRQILIKGHIRSFSLIKDSLEDTKEYVKLFIFSALPIPQRLAQGTMETIQEANPTLSNRVKELTNSLLVSLNLNSKVEKKLTLKEVDNTGFELYLKNQHIIKQLASLKVGYFSFKAQTYANAKYFMEKILSKFDTNPKDKQQIQGNTFKALEEIDPHFSKDDISAHGCPAHTVKPSVISSLTQPKHPGYENESRPITPLEGFLHMVYLANINAFYKKKEKEQ
jgi:uncharacterized lipoprotein YehR (DUF1307 family)